MSSFAVLLCNELLSSTLLLRPSMHPLPLVVVLPSDISQYVDCLPDGIIIRKEAFWYQLPTEKTFSKNKTSVTIEIPKTNRVNTELFPNLFSTLWA